MKTEKKINLTAYTVEYIDQREPKPRTVHTQTVVLDGGKISALNRLDMRPAGWITQQFERDGYTVASIHKGETIAARVDLTELYEFCNEVLKLWNARPVDDESWVNLVFMLSSVFVAGMVYARDGGYFKSED